MRTFNLFRRKRQQDLYCAVPEDYAVPSFLNPREWEFGGKVEHPAASPGGFDPKAASTSVRFNGFYLFQAFDRR